MFDEVLSMPLVLNILGFWIARDSEYVSGFECTRVLNIPEFWVCQGYTGFRICLDNSQICLKVWTRKCLDMSEFVAICVNMSKSAWMAFVLHFPISQFVLQSLVYLNSLLLYSLKFIVWRNMKLFSWEDKNCFFL